MRRMITIKEISEMLHVSPTTVSNVIHGKTTEVSPDTVKRVQAAIQEYHYVPNMSAGRGWTALVAVYVGARKPALIVVACFVFALAESYSNFAQGASLVPAEFLLALPYAATLAALVAGAWLVRGSKPVR